MLLKPVVSVCLDVGCLRWPGFAAQVTPVRLLGLPAAGAVIDLKADSACSAFLLRRGHLPQRAEAGLVVLLNWHWANLDLLLDYGSKLRQAALFGT